MDKPKFFRAPLSVAGIGSFHQAVGHAIESYAKVEAELANLLRHTLDTDARRASAIFSAVQGARSRGELFSELLTIQFEGKLDAHWAACNKFLGVLAKFRNALAHWQPHIHIAMVGNLTVRHHTLGPMVPGGLEHITEDDIEPFLTDCLYIRTEIGLLAAIVRDRPSSLPEIFQLPPIRPPSAVLRQSPRPTKPRPPRAPSIPKLTKAQKKAKARKEARKRAQNSE